jgi:cation-transporting P-type ATPase I
VAAAGLGSAALLAGIVQTPGLSQFFGCTPLGPLGWGIALGTSTAATALSVVASPLLDRLPFARLGSPDVRPGEHAGESVEPFDGALALRSP